MKRTRRVRGEAMRTCRAGVSTSEIVRKHGARLFHRKMPRLQSDTILYCTPEKPRTSVLGFKSLLTRADGSCAKIVLSPLKTLDFVLSLSFLVFRASPCQQGDHITILTDSWHAPTLLHEMLFLLFVASWLPALCGAAVFHSSLPPTLHVQFNQEKWSDSCL